MRLTRGNGFWRWRSASGLRIGQYLGQTMFQVRGEPVGIVTRLAFENGKVRCVSLESGQDAAAELMCKEGKVEVSWREFSA